MKTSFLKNEQNQKTNHPCGWFDQLVFKHLNYTDKKVEAQDEN